MGDHGARQLSPLFARRVLRWDARNRVYRLELDDGFRQVLRELAGQLPDLLAAPDSPVMSRVFPPAYSDPADAAHQEEFRRLMLEDLVERRRQECQTLLDTVDAKTLTEEQLMAWSRTINSLRLALGTYLDVSEDDLPGPPRSAEESAYQFLSWLLEESVEALSTNL